MSSNRVIVRIHCKNCGERFTLRGRRNRKGKVETGFRRCLCDNDENFQITTEDET